MKSERLKTTPCLAASLMGQISTIEAKMKKWKQTTVMATVVMNITSTIKVALKRKCARCDKRKRERERLPSAIIKCAVIAGGGEDRSLSFCLPV